MEEVLNVSHNEKSLTGNEKNKPGHLQQQGTSWHGLPNYSHPIKREIVRFMKMYLKSSGKANYKKNQLDGKAEPTDKLGMKRIGIRIFIRTENSTLADCGVEKFSQAGTKSLPFPEDWTELMWIFCFSRQVTLDIFPSLFNHLKGHSNLLQSTVELQLGISCGV